MTSASAAPPPELLDEPIQAVSEDDFDRAEYAHALAHLLHDMPGGSSARLGLYGEWGEGKTSVMKLMAAELERLGDAVVFFTPWTARSRDEAWDLLLGAIRKANKTLQLRYRLARQTSALGRVVMATAAKFSKTAETAEAIVEDKLGGLTEALTAKARRGVLEETVRKLGPRKLVVFVDDLDRTEAALLRSLLMAFRDLFNLPNFFYVLGVSPKVIAEGLASDEASSLENAQRFLEKIVEYPTYLPSISQEGIDRLVDRATTYAPDALRREPLSAVSQYLPTNPRRLKVFLRHITSIRRLLRRFDDDELDWSALYIAQLLRLEFPAATRALAADKAGLANLESRHFTELIAEKHQSSSQAERTPLPEEAYAPSNREERARFLALCAALGNRGWNRGRYKTYELLTLFEAPPLITWRELSQFVTSVHDARERNTEPRGVLDWINEASQATGDFINRVRVGFDMILEMRDGQLDYAIEMDSVEQMREGISSAQTTLALLQNLVHESTSRDIDFLAPESFLKFLAHVRKWSAFYDDELFTRTREDEREVLSEWRDRLRPEFSLTVIEKIPAVEDYHRTVVSAEFSALDHTVREKLQTQAAELLVEGFLVPGRLDSFRGKDWHGKPLLFDPSSAFHFPAQRTRLLEVTGLAASRPEVQENFLSYLRLLFYGAFERSETISRDDCRALLGEKEFLTSVWNAALARPINARTVGSLREMRNQMISSGWNEAVMPLPDWWAHLEETFFQSTPVSGAKSEDGQV